MVRIIEPVKFCILTVNSQRILCKIICSHTEEINLFCQLIADDGSRRGLDHDTLLWISVLNALLSKRSFYFLHNRFDLANLAVGRFRGGLAYVNCLSSMFFGGISGSAVADVSSLGSVVIPMMKQQGYTEDFSVGLTVTTACQGVLIPPSHNMVIYALAAVFPSARCSWRARCRALCWAAR